MFQISLLLKGSSADSSSAVPENRNDDAKDDMITLRGCGRITKWRFPQNSKRCPVRTCHKNFGFRADAIQHYKRCHAPHSILCPICSKVIVVRGRYKFIQHCTRTHPDKKIPFGLDAHTSSKVSKFEFFRLCYVDSVLIWYHSVRRCV